MRAQLICLCNAESSTSRFAQRLYLSEHLIRDYREAQADQNNQDQGGGRVADVPTWLNQSYVQLVPNDFNGQCDQEQKVGKYEDQKEFVVTVAKAIVHEGTVMVEKFSALATKQAVEGGF